jgi:hypothetical protein
MFPKVILASLLLAAISPPSKILCGRFFYILNSIYKKANKKYWIISRLVEGNVYIYHT